MNAPRQPTARLVEQVYAWVLDNPGSTADEIRGGVEKRREDVFAALADESRFERVEGPGKASRYSARTGALEPFPVVPRRHPEAAFGFPGVESSATGLRINSDLNFDEWSELVVGIGRAAQALQWMLGDALAWGERRFGETYAQISVTLEQAGVALAPGTLANLVSVCTRVAPSLRNEGLPFAHHAAVAKLDPAEQRQWLARAASERWSVRRLRDEISAPAVTPPLPDGVFDVPDDRAGPWRTSKSVEWYTPPHVIAAVRRVLGEIDLDPASCAAANETVRAARFYTAADDGLKQPWWGRVWLNPPYGGGAAAFSRRLLDEYEAGRVEAAILLVNGYSMDTAWFHRLLAHPILLVRGRIKFTGPDAKPGNTTGSVFVYLGRDEPLFVSVFSQFGTPLEQPDVVPVDRLLDVPQKPKTPEWA